jgi:hypothetical protein
MIDSRSKDAAVLMFASEVDEGGKARSSFAAAQA